MSKPRTSARAPSSSPSREHTAPDAPRIVGHSLALGSARIALHSGAVHYFRLTAHAWRPALEAIKQLGLPMVETYIPWGVHELSEGRFDFGEHDPSKGLGAFLDLAQSLGLYAVVRPGPNINAELTYFGLPERIVFDERCQARSPRGNPVPFIAPPRMFPVPSYASERFLAETDTWLAEVATVLRPRLWPAGPVVMVQVDNEAAFYFRDGPYDQDYHPDALAKFRVFVRERYGTLEALRAAYDVEHASWDAVEPPQRFAGEKKPALRRQLDWMRFHEALICGALARMRATLRELGFGHLPTSHNLPLGEAGLPATLARIDRDHDVVGLDYYHRRHELSVVRERTLRLVGSAKVAYAPEMGVGAPMWFAPRSDEDSLHTLLCACAYGVRGMNLYMAVDRDRWYGAPFGPDGQPRPSAAALTRVFHALARASFHELTRKTEVAIMLPKEYSQLSRATHTLGALSPTLLAFGGSGASAACLRDPLGFAEPIQLAWSELVTRFSRALSQAGVPYVYIESDAPIERYQGLKVLIAPSYEFAAVERWQRLHDLARRGVTVAWGPRLPEIDDALRPHPFDPPARGLPLGDLKPIDAEQVVRALITELGLARPFPCSPRTVDAVAHEDPRGVRVLFVVHADDGLCAAEVQLPEPMALVDALTDERYEGAAFVTVPLTGHSVRMFLCEPLHAEKTRTRPRSRAPAARRSAPAC